MPTEGVCRCSAKASGPDCASLLQAKGIVDRMGRLREPAGAGFGDDHVVLEAHAEFAVDADGRLVREGHAGLQHGLVALPEIGAFMHIEADAVAGAVRQAGGRIARPETGDVYDGAGGDVDILAAVAGFGGGEARGLCRLLPISDVAPAPGRV